MYGLEKNYCYLTESYLYNNFDISYYCSTNQNKIITRNGNKSINHLPNPK